MGHAHEAAEPVHAAPSPTGRVVPAACPRCGAAALIRKEGCDSCLDCGYSKCG
jgi:ribonucleoside-diphosphate reductase alpha chain